MNDMNPVLRKIDKPIYVIRMSGDRMHHAQKRIWVKNMAQAAAETVKLCEEWLRNNPPDGSQTREERRRWNGFGPRRPAGDNRV